MENLTINKANAVLESPNSSLEELAGVGCLLQAQIREWQNKLEEVKTRIREETPPETGVVNIQSETGSVSVTRPPTQWVARKGVTVDQAIELLGSLHFHRVFEVKSSYSPRKNFHEMMAELPEGSQQSVMLCVSHKPMKPRVGFKPS